VFAITADEALLVADDTGGTIWRIVSPTCCPDCEGMLCGLLDLEALGLRVGVQLGSYHGPEPRRATRRAFRKAITPVDLRHTDGGCSCEFA
jgi:hypothetical protein